jgi:hypothetical protein
VATIGDHAVLSNQCSRFADAAMEEVEDFPNYVPSDGDCLHLIFGPAGAPSVYGTPTPTGTPAPTGTPSPTAAPGP